MHVAREEVGLTQADLAKRLDEPQSFVSKYESGDRDLDLTQFILICNALYVEPTAMLKRLEESGMGFGKEPGRSGKKKEEGRK